MKYIILVAILLFASQIVQAQDSVFLKTGKFIIGKTQEVNEEYILLLSSFASGPDSVVRISSDNIAKIKYYGGYTDILDSSFFINRNDKIQLITSKTVDGTIVEIGDSDISIKVFNTDAVLVITKDSIAAVSYNSGYIETYNQLIKMPEIKEVIAKKETEVSNDPVKKTEVSSLAKEVKKEKKEQEPLPEKKDKKKETTDKHDAVATAVSNEDKATIGIGFITDSVSNIANQYQVYEMLAINAINTSDNKKLLPILTLRRGLCDYYLNGTTSKNLSTFNLWNKGKLVSQIKIANSNSWSLTMMSLYNKLDSVINNRIVLAKYKRVLIPELSTPEITEDKSLKYNFLLLASNYTPPLDDYADISKAYLKSLGNVDTASASYLFSPAFNKLSGREKSRNSTYIRYADVLTDYNVVLPQAPAKPIVSKSSLIDCYTVADSKTSIANKKINSATLKYLEAIPDCYTSTKMDGFFFESSFVNDRAKEAAKKAIFPLYKRPGTVITYLQCGKDFAKKEAWDAAIQCFSSGLLMIDNLNTTSSLKEYLKATCFKEMAVCYERNNQGASAFIAQNLSQIHRKIYESDVFSNDDKSVYDGTKGLTEYFTKVESDAKDARSEKRAAGLRSLLSTITTVASVYNDASQGLTEMSSTTKTYLNGTIALSGQAGEIKDASISTTGTAADVFNKAFGDMVNQLHVNNNDLSSSKPLFATDFISILSNKISTEVAKTNILTFTNLIPSLKEPIKAYLNEQGINRQNLDELKPLYNKFITLEVNIFKTEAIGKTTTTSFFNN